MIDFFRNIVNALTQVINFFKAIFEIITTTIEFIPSPFFEITMIFIPILIASIIYKIIK